MDQTVYVGKVMLMRMDLRRMFLISLEPLATRLARDLPKTVAYDRTYTTKDSDQKKMFDPGSVKSSGAAVGYQRPKSGNGLYSPVFEY
ncbi:hypothetical protein J6590_064663 [Homalodisca vitripennis]|nr:hypothetical protein J6590_064663 [Homalodisca vitripennis]